MLENLIEMRYYVFGRKTLNYGNELITFTGTHKTKLRRKLQNIITGEDRKNQFTSIRKCNVKFYDSF